MIERRFVFRGRWSDRERYRCAWNKLLIRVRILGSVQVTFNDSKQEFEAPAILMQKDQPVDAISFTVDLEKPAPGRSIPTYPIRAINLIVDSSLIIRRKMEPKIVRNGATTLHVVMLATTDNYAVENPYLLEGIGCMTKQDRKKWNAGREERKLLSAPT